MGCRAHIGPSGDPRGEDRPRSRPAATAPDDGAGEGVHDLDGEGRPWRRPRAGRHRAPAVQGSDRLTRSSPARGRWRGEAVTEGEVKLRTRSLAEIPPPPFGYRRTVPLPSSSKGGTGRTKSSPARGRWRGEAVTEGEVNYEPGRSRKRPLHHSAIAERSPSPAKAREEQEGPNPPPQGGGGAAKA